jgi:uncharacterized protein (TIGR02996 family)
MSDEAAFLRAILTSPGDATVRLVYADWLEERGDRRADFLRLEAEIGRLKGEGQSNSLAERRLGEATAAADPAWLAFMTTLGRPFRECPTPEAFSYVEPSDLPFADRIGLRGRVVTFATQFTDPRSWDPELPDDLRFLSALELPDECAYGAASNPVHPFVCELGVDRWPLTGADVLAALKARHFRSAHTRTLNATTIPYPGYHPGTENDEIHNDFVSQYIFERDSEDESAGSHGALKRYVGGGSLWYVLLHTTKHDGQAAHVILLAVGCSPYGRRLVGVITYQMCHSLCE